MSIENIGELIANKWVLNRQRNREITVARNSRGLRELGNKKKTENNKGQPDRLP